MLYKVLFPYDSPIFVIVAVVAALWFSNDFPTKFSLSKQDDNILSTCRFLANIISNDSKVHWPGMRLVICVCFYSVNFRIVWLWSRRSSLGGVGFWQVSLFSSTGKYRWSIENCTFVHCVSYFLWNNTTLQSDPNSWMDENTICSTSHFYICWTIFWHRRKVSGGGHALNPGFSSTKGIHVAMSHFTTLKLSTLVQDCDGIMFTITSILRDTQSLEAESVELVLPVSFLGEVFTVSYFEFDMISQES